MDKKLLKLLYRSFDEALETEDKERLDRALKESEELRREKGRILAQRKTLAESSRGSSFPPFFTERVMHRIEALDPKKNGFESFAEALLFVFRRFAIVGAVIFLLLLIYNLQTGDILSSQEILYTSDFTFEEFLDLPLF